jgi:membrane-bound serine protease (ClpP class)
VMRRLFLGTLIILFGAVTATAQGSVVTVLTVASTIDPISARYIGRGLERARRDGAELVVIQLDTPGGLSSSMDQIVRAILASPVPVAVYVWPQGARAASAGVFVTMAAQIAAMAPGTHIGAAHPVASGGQDIEGAEGQKILNDAIAQLASLTELRGRDASWPEEAVRSSVSLTESQAATRHVVDLSAVNLTDLLARINGKTVSTPRGSVTLRTAAVELRPIPMTAIDRFLGFFANPNLAYLLLVVGIFGIIFELSSPGLVLPGIVGGVALILAFVSFGELPTNLGGILFIIMAIVLFVVDIKAPTHGILTAGGVIAFVMGSLLLFPPWRAPSLPSFPAVHISYAEIAVMTGLVTAFFVFVIAKGFRAQSRRVTFGVETLVGQKGTSLSELSPEGSVRVGGETWSARSAEGAIPAGSPVEVVGREGLCLVVRRRSAEQGGDS